MRVMREAFKLVWPTKLQICKGAKFNGEERRGFVVAYKVPVVHQIPKSAADGSLGRSEDADVLQSV